MMRSVHTSVPTVHMEVGTIEYLDADGAAWVTSPGNSEPVPGRVVLSGPWAAPRLAAGATVLLLLQDRERPVILGDIGMPRRGPETGTRRPDVLIEAAESITLRCGDSSMTMRSDGRVVVTGRRILSRASQTNKIKGASVLIN